MICEQTKLSAAGLSNVDSNGQKPSEWCQKERMTIMDMAFLGCQHKMW